MKELEHFYGEKYHILDDVFTQTLLSFVCREEYKQPTINHLIKDLYDYLLAHVLSKEFPSLTSKVKTRMAAIHEKGYWEGRVINPQTRAVIINLARAGLLPSQLCFERLCRILDPDLVRQDHVIMSRVSNEAGKVIGADFNGSKIGGDKEKAIVLIPDPMAATGSSVAKIIDHYKKVVKGKEMKFISLHLIMTPNFIFKMKREHPDLLAYALRLDRASSTERALSATPGKFPEEENGLTEIDYIVPGAGGLGELMNNSYC
jgi:uracil phosphoribosyltransferase